MLIDCSLEKEIRMKGRIRDDWEMRPDQEKIAKLWQEATTEKFSLNPEI
jgi:trans-2-enoyl-CoA reductase